MNVDFAKQFSCPKDRPLNFKCRLDSNFPHDIIYLDSYLHDAEFYWSKKFLTTKVLKIRFERDCWELPLKRNGLAWAKSILTISPIVSVSLKKTDLAYFDGSKRKCRKCIVKSIYLGEDYWERDMIYSFDDQLNLIETDYSESDVFTLNIRTDDFILKLKLPRGEHNKLPRNIELKDMENPKR